MKYITFVNKFFIEIRFTYYEVYHNLTKYNFSDFF